MSRTVWLVTKESVYDHGVYYVAEAEEDALRFTQEYAPDGDGRHNWRIDSIEVGVPVEGWISAREWMSDRNRVRRL